MKDLFQTDRHGRQVRQQALEILGGERGEQVVFRSRRRVSTHNTDDDKIVYWHRELPPLSAELMAEHTLEATSSQVPGTISHRDELWDRCYLELMANTQIRLAQEVARLGGHYAHVRDESIDILHDDQAGERGPSIEPAPQVPTESETITDAHPAAQNPIESVP